ncbi:DUF7344 domain-containing protein [Natrinema salifodinae]|uniref:DUF7344 domain-containing protein n=1 Tax=Natrinema salifodinae TaxID=1202768 RepID=A0A1I0M905_9EURY|nr:hypothetical protein [Natrinema salifodinae]SEV84240.1 hypothetical protein SAMN05216285_0584 [Natrinema salifodinae]
MQSRQPGGPGEVVERWDRVFAALSAEPRRQIVTELMDVAPGEAVSLPEAGTNPALETEPERLQTQLHHHHLPVLADAGLVQWERDPFRAYRGRDFEEVTIVLESLYANVDAMPDRLVRGCRRLEREREQERDDDGGSSGYGVKG